ncbi:MAG TPA: endonuclease III [Holophagaceae bacterium]|jgi:endonuclease-3|nr:endonuclease III [Holophagaceae bacterium]
MRWTKAKLKELQDRLRAAYPDAKCALDHADPYQLVVATILSAQCTDARVNLTTPALFKRYPDAAALSKAKLPELETLIHSTGFYRNKAKNLLGLGQALMARHGGDVPGDAEALAALPGVGQKTANVVLANAFGVPALAVDTHIFRVARRLGLSAAKTPEKVEEDLCRLFPREDWIELHHQLIFHGRRTCDARKPDCGDCPVLELCDVGRGKAVDPHSGLKLEARGLRQGRSVPAPNASSLKPHHPQRIVSLVPSVTELLAEWGLAMRLVGRTRYCIAPKWIRATVPAVGGTKDPDLAKIAALAPDLVILEKDENPKAVADALTKLGIPWMVLEVKAIRDCLTAWKELGETLGAEAEAAKRVASLKALLPKHLKKGPRTLTLIWREPWMAAGPDTYVADLARQAGFTPIGPDRYPQLTDADIEALDPALILLPTEPYRFNARHTAELRKRFPKARVELVDGQAMTWYLSRTDEGLALLMSLA